MSLNLNNRQKSLKRRFLLLGIIRLVCVVAVGLMIIFWSKLNLNLSYTNKLIVGCLFIVYGLARFAFSLKRELDNEEV